jgi:hypothetical protein
MITLLRTYRSLPALLSLSLLLSVVLPAVRHACVRMAPGDAQERVLVSVEGGHAAAPDCAGRHTAAGSPAAYTPAHLDCCLPAPDAIIGTTPPAPEYGGKLSGPSLAAVTPGPAALPAALPAPALVNETKFLTRLPPSRRYVLFASLLR